MIHPAFNKSELALRYYKIKVPERAYDKAAAKKQFNQDKAIDSKVLAKVVKEVVKEQLKILPH